MVPPGSEMFSEKFYMSLSRCDLNAYINSIPMLFLKKSSNVFLFCNRVCVQHNVFTGQTYNGVCLFKPSTPPSCTGHAEFFCHTEMATFQLRPSGTWSSRANILSLGWQTLGPKGALGWPLNLWGEESDQQRPPGLLRPQSQLAAGLRLTRGPALVTMAT